MGNIVSAASAFRLSKSYLPAHSTFYNAVSISLRSFADAARMWCAEAKALQKTKTVLPAMMQPVCGVLRQSAMIEANASAYADAARMWCAEAKVLGAILCPVHVRMQPVCGVLRQSPMTLTFISMPHDAAHMWC